MTLLNTVATTRRVKTIPRNTSRNSHDSLGHCESVAKEVEKQMRVSISHTWRADHQCNSDRNVARTTTQDSVNAEEQTSLFKWKDAHWFEKLKRADEHLLVIRELTRLARAGRGQARVEKWNLGSVKAVLNRIQELKASTERHTSISSPTEVHHESSVGQTRASTTVHKVHLGRRNIFVQVSRAIRNHWDQRDC